MTRPAARFMVVGGLSSGREEALDVADAHGHACADVAAVRRRRSDRRPGASCYCPALRRRTDAPALGLDGTSWLARLAPATESHPSLAEPVADALATFAANTGQLPSTIRHGAGPGHSVSFTKASALALRPGFALGLAFLGADPEVRLEGAPRLPEWSTTSSAPILPAGVGIPSFCEVVHHDLWLADAVFRNDRDQLKYEFVVRPGARVEDIRLTYDGARPSLEPSGALVIRAPSGVLHDSPPVSFQLIDGQRSSCRVVSTCRAATPTASNWTRPMTGNIPWSLTPASTTQRTWERRSRRDAASSRPPGPRIRHRGVQLRLSYYARGV